DRGPLDLVSRAQSAAVVDGDGRIAALEVYPPLAFASARSRATGALRAGQDGLLRSGDRLDAQPAQNRLLVARRERVQALVHRVEPFDRRGQLVRADVAVARGERHGHLEGLTGVTELCEA